MREDVLMRLLNWDSALLHAERNMAIAEHLSKHGSKEFETVEVCDGKAFRTVIAVEAQQGLREAAVIGFRQVFGKGDPGPGIAGNHDPDIKQIRERMEGHAVTALGLPQAEYDRIMSTVKNQRDERIAHYDGSKAKYERVNPSVTKMNLPGFALLPPDTHLLLRIITAMREFVHKEWVGMATALDAARKELAAESGVS